MPTERFHRLPEEKRMAILEAAIGEFIRVPFEKVSINQIIQKADISRGSFYTYFEDKRDVLSFILKDGQKRWEKVCIDSLANHQGDLWIMLQELFDFGIACCSEYDMVQLYKNTILYPEISVLLGTSPEDTKAGGKTCLEQQQELWERIDVSKLRRQDLDGVMDILFLGMGSLMTALGEFYKTPGDLALIKETYKRRLQMIQYGAYNQADLA
ncbi:MAG: TetR/AcrR family transcriptional regulator [Hungatella sp.]